MELGTTWGGEWWVSVGKDVFMLNQPQESRDGMRDMGPSLVLIS